MPRRYRLGIFWPTLGDSTTPEPVEGAPPKGRRRGRLWQVLAGAAILVVGLAVFFALQGGDGGGGPLNAIAKAAERTQREPGARMVMRAVVSLPTGKSFTMAGHGAYDGAGRSRAVLTVPRTDSQKAAKLEVIGDGGAVYMRSSQFDSLPEGREWMGLDVSSFQEQASGLPAGGDAKGELQLLEAVTGGVQKVGREEVRGVATTRYRGTVEPSENAKRLRELGADGLATQIEEADAAVQVEAWIDAGGLVRRMRLVETQPPHEGKGPTTVDMRMDFFDFGLEPVIEVPDQSEVFDATSSLVEES